MAKKNASFLCLYELVNNLAKLNNSTGYTVCWYYMANGKNYVYRCPLTN